MTERDPTDIETYEAALARVRIGPPQVLSGPIELHPYDPRWAVRYERVAAEISAALGSRVVRLEHVGSTAVPDLPAKPIVDVVLEVVDSADEPSYVPALESAGFELRIREPEWYEHRVLKSAAADVNLHVFSEGCEEVERMLCFRDRLREDAADRELYAAAKRDLAAREWRYTQQYADAKSDVVREILSRA
jgi:GrpB-like predicted nucleotidyltransferase (UPF0157 family)